MSVYRRNSEQKIAQRWYYHTGTWDWCEYDEPETKVRKPNEGMVVAETNDFTAEGPLTLTIDQMLKELKRGG